MTIREISSNLLEWLRAMAHKMAINEEGLKHQKPGEMPSEAPFVWLFIEPAVNTYADFGAGFIGKGKLTIFAGQTGNDAAEARLKAIELCERAVRLAAEYLDEPPETLGFDAVYSDIAVAYAEFIFDYKMTELL